MFLLKFSFYNQLIRTIYGAAEKQDERYCRHLYLVQITLRAVNEVQQVNG